MKNKILAFAVMFACFGCKPKNLADSSELQKIAESNIGKDEAFDGLIQCHRLMDSFFVSSGAYLFKNFQLSGDKGAYFFKEGNNLYYISKKKALVSVPGAVRISYAGDSFSGGAFFSSEAEAFVHELKKTFLDYPLPADYNVVFAKLKSILSSHLNTAHDLVDPENYNGLRSEAKGVVKELKENKILASDALLKLAWLEAEDADRLTGWKNLRTGETISTEKYRNLYKPQGRYSPIYSPDKFVKVFNLLDKNELEEAKKLKSLYSQLAKDPSPQNLEALEGAALREKNLRKKIDGDAILKLINEKLDVLTRKTKSNETLLNEYYMAYDKAVLCRQGLGVAPQWLSQHISDLEKNLRILKAK